MYTHTQNRGTSFFRFFIGQAVADMHWYTAWGTKAVGASLAFSVTIFYGELTMVFLARRLGSIYIYRYIYIYISIHIYT